MIVAAPRHRQERKTRRGPDRLPFNDMDLQASSIGQRTNRMQAQHRRRHLSLSWAAGMRTALMGQYQGPVVFRPQIRAAPSPRCSAISNRFLISSETHHFERRRSSRDMVTTRSIKRRSNGTHSVLWRKH